MKKIPQLSDGPDEASPDDPSPGETKAGATSLVNAPSGDGEREREGGRTPPAFRSDTPAGGAVDAAGETGVAERRDGDADRTRAEGAPAASGTPSRKSSRGGKKPARGPARRFARERALQALYQWDMADAESSTVRREFIEHQDMSRVDVEYFERLFRGISHDVERVDEALGAALDRPLGEVDPIERAVLRIAAFEMAEVLETPARVIINEGVEITKRFGAENGHRYVNGVLDGLATTLRPLEMRRG